MYTSLELAWRDCAVEAVERIIRRLRVRKLKDGAVAQNDCRDVLPGIKVSGTLNPHRLRTRCLELQLETAKSRIQ